MHEFRNTAFSPLDRLSWMRDWAIGSRPTSRPRQRSTELSAAAGQTARELHGLRMANRSSRDETRNTPELAGPLHGTLRTSGHDGAVIDRKLFLDRCSAPAFAHTVLRSLAVAGADRCSDREPADMS